MNTSISYEQLIQTTHFDISFGNFKGSFEKNSNQVAEDGRYYASAINVAESNSYQANAVNAIELC
jgi:hypothetical protein